MYVCMMMILLQGALGSKGDDRKEWQFLCAAFLISPKFAVTTAHCARGTLRYKPPEIIRFGIKNLNDNVSTLMSY
jgi:V8-like Glu-specific endopeptidase